MPKESYELIVIGGGPAGLAAALGAKASGLKDILIVERQPVLGGVLFQCVHTGFGLHYFGEELSGPEYADRFIAPVRKAQIEVMTDSSVLRIGDDRRIIISSAQEGVICLHTKAVILATGCRERPIGALPVAGTRPSGIFTAGAVQRMINLKGYDVGERFLILGSGDIGLIMARRLTLLGKTVIAVIEQYPYCTGLLRNRVQCLEDFGIPLLTGHTVGKIFGEQRLTGAAVCPVDENLDPVLNQGFDISCDTLITSVGLIPETELLDSLGLKRAGGLTGSLDVNGWMQTSLPWVFVCGNALFVHDLVDNVTVQAEKTGEFAADFVLGRESGTLTESLFYSVPLIRMASNEIACTLCPKSCVLTVDGGKVAGAGCQKGSEYARQELSDPKRYVTATVAVTNCPHRRLPVRSSIPVPKDKIAGIMKELNNIAVSPPVGPGQVIIRNAAGSNTDIIATTKLR